MVTFFGNVFEIASMIFPWSIEEMRYGGEQSIDGEHLDYLAVAQNGGILGTVKFSPFLQSL